MKFEWSRYNRIEQASQAHRDYGPCYKFPDAGYSGRVHYGRLSLLHREDGPCEIDNSNISFTFRVLCKNYGTSTEMRKRYIAYYIHLYKVLRVRHE
jgi:hypothetical protein